MAPLKSPWPRNFRPAPNSFASQFNTLSAAIGTGGRALTGTATTNVFVDVPRARTFAVINASMQGPTAAGGDGVITAQLIRYDSTNASAITLTAATSITAGVISSATVNNVEWTVTPASTSANVCVPGDSLYWKVAAAGTAATAPELRGVVEIAVIS
jgi:hypothetical protein